jgi:hypothetical protein
MDAEVNVTLALTLPLTLHLHKQRHKQTRTHRDKQRHKQTRTDTDTHHLFGSLHMDSEVDVPERPRPKFLRDLVRFVGPHLGLRFKV